MVQLFEKFPHDISELKSIMQVWYIVGYVTLQSGSMEQLEYAALLLFLRESSYFDEDLRREKIFVDRVKTHMRGHKYPMPSKLSRESFLTTGEAIVGACSKADDERGLIYRINTDAQVKAQREEIRRQGIAENVMARIHEEGQGMASLRTFDLEDIRNALANGLSPTAVLIFIINQYIKNIASTARLAQRLGIYRGSSKGGARKWTERREKEVRSFLLGKREATQGRNDSEKEFVEEIIRKFLENDAFCEALLNRTFELLPFLRRAGEEIAIFECLRFLSHDSAWAMMAHKRPRAYQLPEFLKSVGNTELAEQTLDLLKAYGDGKISRKEAILKLAQFGLEEDLLLREHFKNELVSALIELDQRNEALEKIEEFLSEVPEDNDVRAQILKEFSLEQGNLIKLNKIYLLLSKGAAQSVSATAMKEAEDILLSFPESFFPQGQAAERLTLDMWKCYAEKEPKQYIVESLQHFISLCSSMQEARLLLENDSNRFPDGMLDFCLTALYESQAA